MNRDLTIRRKFVDVETAKQAGRTGFGEMLAFLRKEKTCRILLVEKTDRLYRNLKDWVTLDELDLEIHLVKENIVISRDSRSSEKFMHGIKVLMAKNYIDNLSEETKKGMLEKARQGMWPSCAPLGYLNVMGADGRRTIAPNPDLAPIIRTHVRTVCDRPALLEGNRQTRAPGRYAIPQEQAPRTDLHHSQDSAKSDLHAATLTSMGKHTPASTSRSYLAIFGHRSRTLSMGVTERNPAPCGVTLPSAT